MVDNGGWSAIFATIRRDSLLPRRTRLSFAPPPFSAQQRRPFRWLVRPTHASLSLSLSLYVDSSALGGATSNPCASIHRWAQQPAAAAAATAPGETIRDLNERRRDYVGFLLPSGRRRRPATRKCAGRRRRRRRRRVVIAAGVTVSRRRGVPVAPFHVFGRSTGATLSNRTSATAKEGRRRGGAERRADVISADLS